MRLDGLKACDKLQPKVEYTMKRRMTDGISMQEWEEAKHDMVNNPPHYNNGQIECIVYLRDNLGTGFSYYCEGNVKKYLHRWRHKGQAVQDLEKAQWYLAKLIESQSLPQPD